MARERGPIEAQEKVDKSRMRNKELGCNRGNVKTKVGRAE